ncbi:MAG: ATP-binding protein, partial [Boseongicola sp.]|nr:ATP-binding protein [Boseongicola sp.]
VPPARVGTPAAPGSGQPFGLPVADWHQQIGEPTIADAILDRLVHGAIRFELHGSSMRADSAEAGK